jgi:hypothetical protein
MCPKDSVFFAAILTAGLLAAGVRADDSPANDKPDEALQSEDARARSKFMMDALAEYQVEVKDGSEFRRPKLVPAPALRWTNTVSGTKDGVVGVWTSGGRPDVVVQFAGYGQLWIHHFESTSLAPLTMERNGRTLWTPRSAGVVLQPVPDAPAPADTAVKRQVQMRRLAERFEVTDDFHPIYQDPKTERHTLRLLTKPLYRYEAAGDLVDGALFGYVLATDPEALLMVEAWKTEEGTAWRYALAPMTVYGLIAKLDGKEVWNRPENRVWKIDDTCRVGAH